MSKQSNSSGGISALSLLGLMFVALKLFGVTDVAEWSWWWVTAPFWGALALTAAFLLIGGVFAVALIAIEEFRK